MKKLALFASAIPMIFGTFQLHAQEVKTIIGNGYTLLQYRSVGEFSAVDISGALSLFITQGDTMPITIDADDNLFQYIITEVKGGTLYIHPAENVDLKHSKGSSIFLSTPTLHGITARNKAVVQGSKNISGNQLILNADNGSIITIKVNYKTIKIDCGQASLIKLKGHASELIINNNTEGTIDTGKLQIQNSPDS